MVIIHIINNIKLLKAVISYSKYTYNFISYNIKYRLLLLTSTGTEISELTSGANNGR